MLNAESDGARQVLLKIHPHLVSIKRMANYTRTLLLVAFGAVISSGACGQTKPLGHRSCELGYDNSIFAPKSWPERDLDSYALRNLGIVVPQYDHFYLFIAYRKLSALSLTATDVERLRPFDPCWDDGSRQWHGHDGWSASPMQSAQEAWRDARARVLAPSERSQQNGSYDSVLGYLGRSVPNCNPDAYRNAAHTLLDRLAVHGGDPFVVEWARGQDLVLGKCTAVSDELPAAAPVTAPDWYRHDRAYQTAAAHFYAGHYQRAAEAFDAIAQETSSPWKDIAPYLTARSLIRQASIDRAADNEALLTDARTRLDAAGAATKDEALRADIARLAQRVRLTLEPQAVKAELDQHLSAATLPQTIGQDVRDFDTKALLELPADADGRRFSQWLDAMRSTPELNGGEGRPANDLWLVAALQNSNVDGPQVPQLLARASRVPKASPAYYTAQYHIVRLTPEHDRAMRITRELLALPDDEFSRQDKNRLKAAAIGHARTPPEFALLAYRQPLAMTSARYDKTSLPVVDSATAKVLNGALPLDTLFALYADPATPAPLRDELQGVVWVRGLVLKRWDVLHRLKPALQARLASASPILSQLDAAEDPAEKAAIGAMFLARYPGLVGSIATEIRWASLGDVGDIAIANMRPSQLEEGSRGNWWCSLPEGRYFASDPAVPEVPLPAFIGKKAAATWKDERAKLQATPNATDYLAKTILSWASIHPRDERLPPALRMLVRSSRGGCVSQESAGLGRTAFRHLHRHFPGREESKLTRVHY